MMMMIFEGCSSTNVPDKEMAGCIHACKKAYADCLIHRLMRFFVEARVLVLARARTPNESACVVPPRQLLLVLHHVLQAVCDFACELLVEKVRYVKK